MTPAWRAVEEYCALGWHRTGSVVDRATLDWFADQLSALGGQVEQRPFTFDRFVADCTVTIDATSVGCEPLPYEAIGDIESTSVHRGCVTAMVGDRASPALDAEIAAGRESNADVVVIATDHAHGELSMPNRVPALGSGLPVVLVAGRHGAALRDGSVEVDYMATVIDGVSANVVASFPASGGVDRRPIVLATPLSGWFACAAERATGIATLLALVERFAGRHPIVVVGASGHELLHHIGLEHHLADGAPDAAVIAHLGANVAVAVTDPHTGESQLAPGMAPGVDLPAARGALARVTDRHVGPVREALGRAALEPYLDPPQWFGEGALWAAASAAPLLSFVGRSPYFHTPADVPATATTPDALTIVTGAIGDAIEAIVG